MMQKLHTKDYQNFIVYNHIESNKKNEYSVIFLHGLMSDMEGAKALYCKEFCKSRDYNYVRFDNFGHGLSSGNFIDHNIGSWLDGLELVLEHVNSNKVLLVGSSMGGWVAILAAMRSKFKNDICGVITLAAAVDFTEDLIWNKMTEKEKDDMEQLGFVSFASGDCSDAYPISHQLITESRQHLLLNRDHIRINCPIHLIHGMLDEDVPYNLSMKLANKVTTDNCVVKLIKDAGHRLSRESDLRILGHSIDEILTTYQPLSRVL